MPSRAFFPSSPVNPLVEVYATVSSIIMLIGYGGNVNVLGVVEVNKSSIQLTRGRNGSGSGGRN